MRKKLRSQKGFTLIELIVAVGIMLILAAAATPFLLSHIKDAKVSSFNEELLNVKAAFDSYFAKNGGLISDSDGDGDFLDEMIDAGWISNDPSRHNLTWTVKSHTDSGKVAYYIHITNEADEGGYTYFGSINGDVDEAVDGTGGEDDGRYQYADVDTDSDSNNDTIRACYLLQADGGMSSWHPDGATDGNGC